ncbi:MAG: Rieske (2Fe-2S) protein [Bacillota bacterium]
MSEQPICSSSALEDGGPGVRFVVDESGLARNAFAVRHFGRVSAFINQCPHAWTELDWEPGKFFDFSKLYLICATHGAMFEPHNGRCVAGPCRGAALEKLDIVERDGDVYLIETSEVTLKTASDNLLRKKTTG